MRDAPDDAKPRASSAAEYWPEFHLTRYANQVVLFLVAFSLFKWYGEDVSLLGFNSYASFAAWLSVAVTGHGLTLFVVSRRAWSRYWTVALAVTLAILAVSGVGIVGLWGSPLLQDRFGLAVTFVLCAHILNLVSLIRVARLRRRR